VLRATLTIQPIQHADILRVTKKAGRIFNRANISDIASPDIAGKEKAMTGVLRRNRASPSGGISRLVKFTRLCQRHLAPIKVQNAVLF
jgi:hypothetical protein